MIDYKLHANSFSKKNKKHLHIQKIPCKLAATTDVMLGIMNGHQPNEGLNDGAG